jgi:SsrA-binding protein
MSKKIIVTNRKARFNYEILDTLEAGIVLQGTEVKSLRVNGASLQESYIKIIQSEVYLIGCHIPPYSHGNLYNHPERRDRKLLLHKREREKLKIRTEEKGMALVPLSLYFSNGKIKVEIGVGRGKKLYDKRQSVKERDEKRYMDTVRKNYG